jgi:hypothetical protein
MTAKHEPIDVIGSLIRGTRIKRLEIEGPEEPEDKRLRRRKDFLAFLVKDLLAYIVAFGFISAIGTYCFVVLLKHGAASEEAQKVWPIVSAILSGIMGMVFGRATK